MKTHFQLDVAKLAWLSGLVQVKKTIISPLNFPVVPSLTPEQSAELHQAGLVDELNAISSAAQPVLDSLASAEAFARVNLSGPGQQLDYAAYFGSGATGEVGIVSSPAGLEIEFPVDPASFLDRVEALTGSSAHTNQEWEATLPPLEALALAVLIDQRRRAVLRAVADDRPSVPGPSDPLTLTGVINATLDVPQWLVSVVKNIAAIPLPVPDSQVLPAFQALISTGLAIPSLDQIFPSQPVMALADRMLLVGNVITVNAAHANLQDAVATRRIICLQSGLADLLCLEMTGGLVHLRCLSAAQLLDLLEDYLTNEDAVAPFPLVKKDLYLEIVAGPGMGLTYPLTGDLVIGRGQDCDIHLLDFKASRHHAAIRKLVNGFEITDLGSTNGTQLNGQTIGTAQLLSDGDVITVGETQFKAKVGEPPARLPQTEATIFSAGIHQQPAAPELPAAPSEPLIEPVAIPPLEPIPPMQPVPPAEPLPPIPLAPPLPVEPEVVFPPVVEAAVPEPVEMPEVPVVAPEPPFMPPTQEPTQPPPSAGVMPPPPPGWGPEVSDVRRCPNCASQVTAEARFCGVCGTRL